MEEKLVELLESIGLTKNEIEVYIDLLKNPASTAYAIAYRINQHRSSVYEAIKRLLQKGFIVEIQEESRKLYQTKEHTAIESYLKQKQVDLQQLAPFLQEITNTSMPAGSVSVSYGLTRLRTAFSNIFDLHQEILIWILPKNVDEVLGDWFLKEISETIIKKEVPTKIIYSEYFDVMKEITKNPFTEARYIDEDANIFTIACADTVFLIVLADPITVIEMKNINVAEGFKSRFRTFWEKAEKTRTQK